ncbi:unnamed protein product, partial [Polarella glacialis]
DPLDDTMGMPEIEKKRKVAADDDGKKKKVAKTDEEEDEPMSSLEAVKQAKAKVAEMEKAKAKAKAAAKPAESDVSSDEEPAPKAKAKAKAAAAKPADSDDDSDDEPAPKAKAKAAPAKKAAVADDDEDEEEAPPAKKQKTEEATGSMAAAGAEEELTVFVGGLPWSTSEEQIKKDFTECGEITRLNILCMPLYGKLQDMVGFERAYRYAIFYLSGCGLIMTLGVPIAGVGGWIAASILVLCGFMKGFDAMRGFVDSRFCEPEQVSRFMNAQWIAGYVMGSFVGPIYASMLNVKGETYWERALPNMIMAALGIVNTTLALTVLWSMTNGTEGIGVTLRSLDTIVASGRRTFLVLRAKRPLLGKVHPDGPQVGTHPLQEKPGGAKLNPRPDWRLPQSVREATFQMVSQPSDTYVICARGRWLDVIYLARHHVCIYAAAAKVGTHPLQEKPGGAKLNPRPDWRLPQFVTKPLGRGAWGSYSQHVRPCNPWKMLIRRDLLSLCAELKLSCHSRLLPGWSQMAHTPSTTATLSNLLRNLTPQHLQSRQIGAGASIFSIFEASAGGLVHPRADSKPRHASSVGSSSSRFSLISDTRIAQLTLCGPSAGDRDCFLQLDKLEAVCALGAGSFPSLVQITSFIYQAGYRGCAEGPGMASHPRKTQDVVRWLNFAMGSEHENRHVGSEKKQDKYYKQDFITALATPEFTCAPTKHVQTASTKKKCSPAVADLGLLGKLPWPYAETRPPACETMPSIERRDEASSI